MSYIYFVQIADTGPIKIGFTSRPPRIRITKMQTDVPWPIKIIGVIKGTEVQEKQIRHILRDYSIDREWLDPHPTVLAAIELALERGERVSCRIRPKKEYNSKLATFLEEQGITDAEFGRQIGVERHTVGRYKAGDRFPSKHILLNIHKVTQGQVTANDFANLPNNPVRA